MVQYKELRFGNVFLHQELGFLYYFRMKDDETVIFKDNNDGIRHELFLSDVRPIPLVRQVLLNCGFQKWNDPADHLNLQIVDGHPNGFRFHLDFMHGIFYFKSRYDTDNFHVQLVSRLRNFHQLQNFYFALTEMELEFNIENFPINF